LSGTAVYKTETGVVLCLALPALPLDSDIVMKAVDFCEVAISSSGNITSMRDLKLLDRLTGLLNISGFCRDLTYIACPAPLSHATLMYIDIHGLATLNNHLGHDHGDKALLSIAAGLKRHTGNKGQVYRLKGNEFCILVEDKQDNYEEEARTLQKIVHRQEKGLQLSATVAVARYKGQSIKELLEEVGAHSDVIERFFERRLRVREEAPR
jgi:diguanylate cyclase (GGDEF)-like protein